MQPGDDSQQEWTFTLYNFDNTDEVKKEVREGFLFLLLTYFRCKMSLYAVCISVFCRTCPA